MQFLSVLLAQLLIHAADFIDSIAFQALIHVNIADYDIVQVYQ